MGWPKGVRRKKDMFSDIPEYVHEFVRKVGANIGPITYTPSRKEILRAIEQAKMEFVDSGEHTEAEKHHPGTKDWAERDYWAILNRDRNGKEGLRRANMVRAIPAEQRRQWIARYCFDCLFWPSRKKLIAEIQARLVSAHLPPASSSRLYADIAAIRKGWNVSYFSRAKDNP
jgi:hypothetical protein